ncbi:MAG: methyltransferase [bacterium]|nr:methyltransferase [bacterium]
MTNAIKPLVTEDAFLGGRLRLRQPAQGYRITQDAVYLASIINLKPQEKILDVGTGVGAALFCLGARISKGQLWGIEVLKDLFDLSQENIKLNNMENRAQIIWGDISKSVPDLTPNSFDHVMSNPPYLRKGHAISSPVATKHSANIETTVDLQDWLCFCLKMLKPGGVFSLIYTIDRLDEALGILQGKGGDCVICPLWPRQNKPAKRFLLQMRKGGRGKAILLPGVTIRDDQGNMTESAESIQRHGQALDLKGEPWIHSV